MDIRKIGKPDFQQMDVRKISKSDVADFQQTAIMREEDKPTGFLTKKEIAIAKTLFGRGISGTVSSLGMKSLEEVEKVNAKVRMLAEEIQDMDIEIKKENKNG